MYPELVGISTFVSPMQRIYRIRAESKGTEEFDFEFTVE